MSILLLNQDNTQLREQIEFSLAEIEGRFSEELLSDLSCVNNLVSHVEQYRGKMLRPTLVLISGIASAEEGDVAGLSEAHRVVATVVELVHMATLVHDDVLDDARIRRRGCTVNELRGNEPAVMLGDYLISHAYHLCSSLDRPAINHLIASATNTVSEGELLQLANRNNWDLDEQPYFELIRRKTASLCGTCCRVAAVLHDAPFEVGDHLYNYGEKLGVAYQIVDDVLDLVGTEKTVGKTLGRDVQKGGAAGADAADHGRPEDRERRIAPWRRAGGSGSRHARAQRFGSVCERSGRIARGAGKGVGGGPPRYRLSQADAGYGRRRPDATVLARRLPDRAAALGVVWSGEVRELRHKLDSRRGLGRRRPVAVDAAVRGDFHLVNHIVANAGFGPVSGLCQGAGGFGHQVVPIDETRQRFDLRRPEAGRDRWKRSTDCVDSPHRA